MQSFMLSSKSAQFLEYMDLRTRTIWAYLKYASSYSIFCVYITKFLLQWQQELI